LFFGFSQLRDGNRFLPAGKANSPNVIPAWPSVTTEALRLAFLLLQPPVSMKKVALGLGVALAGVCCMVIKLFLLETAWFRDYRTEISIALAGAGLLALLAGLLMARRNPNSAGERSGKEKATEVFPLFSLRFWGVMLVIISGLTQLVCMLPELRKVIQVPSLVAQMKERLPSVETNAPKAEPPIKLQGILYEPQKGLASAIVNGESVQAGDEIAGYKVVAVKRDGIEIANAEGVKLVEIQGWVQGKVRLSP
jgi:hypothetical protein